MRDQDGGTLPLWGGRIRVWCVPPAASTSGAPMNRVNLDICCSHPSSPDKPLLPPPCTHSPALGGAQLSFLGGGVPFLGGLRLLLPWALSLAPCVVCVCPPPRAQPVSVAAKSSSLTPPPPTSHAAVLAGGRGSCAPPGLRPSIHLQTAGKLLRNQTSRVVFKGVFVSGEQRGGVRP